MPCNGFVPSVAEFVIVSSRGFFRRMEKDRKPVPKKSFSTEIMVFAFLSLLWRPYAVSQNNAEIFF